MVGRVKAPPPWPHGAELAARLGKTGRLDFPERTVVVQRQSEAYANARRLDGQPMQIREYSGVQRPISPSAVYYRDLVRFAATDFQNESIRVFWQLCWLAWLNMTQHQRRHVKTRF